MTNEERDIIAAFIARVGGAPAGQPSTWGGSGVPATQPQLPPVDREADSFIGEQFQRYPEARYRITQLAFVQEHALVEAQNRIRRMEWELQQAQQAAQQAAQQSQGHGGFFSGLFGGGRSQQSAPPPRGAAWGQGAQAAPPPGYQYGAPPPPQYPPGYNPGLFQRQGSGFLGSALTTAAGVAGGVLAADAIRDLFSPHGVGGGLGGLGGGGTTIIENNPWTGTEPPMPPNDPGYVDQGSWGTPDPATGQPDQGYTDTGGWDQGAADPGGADQGGWDQGGADQGGWDQGGGSDDDSLI